MIDQHEEDCACVIDGLCHGEIGRAWVEHEHWTDADVCTCPLKDVMARRKVYGDERLVKDLPFEVAIGEIPALRQEP